MRALLLVAFLAGAPSAQAQRTIDLTGDPAHTLSEPFSNIAGVRALPDGRAIVTDQMERRVFVVNVSADEHRQTGRDGSGPGEYRFPMQPLAAPNDYTWLLDASLRRLLVVSLEGRITSSLSPPYGAQPGGLAAARGTDASGRLYFEGSSFNAETGDFIDSVSMIRWDPTRDRVTVLGRVWSGGRLRVDRGGMVASVARSITPFPAIDAWVVLPDGRVVIVQQSPHRIRFVDTAGVVTQSADIAFSEIAINAAERDAYRAREAGARMVAAGGSGGAAMQRPPTSDAEFPRTMPAFVAASVIAAPNGEIWIGRSFTHSARVRTYDVYDARGQRVATARLRAGSAVVGFGDGVIYVARTDPADHLVYLEQFAHK